MFVEGYVEEYYLEIGNLFMNLPGCTYSNEYRYTTLIIWVQ